MKCCILVFSKKRIPPHLSLTAIDGVSCSIIMNEYEATIQINPTDDIKFILEESGCYESEIEMMKAGGTYDAFVKRVYDAIDWSHLFERIAQMENDAITAAIDKLSDSMI